QRDWSRESRHRLTSNAPPTVPAPVTKVDDRTGSAYSTDSGGRETADVAQQETRSFFVDKKLIQQIVAEQNERMGFVPDPTATAEKAQAKSLALGIRPEDNMMSSAIIAARDEE